MWDNGVPTIDLSGFNCVIEGVEANGIKLLVALTVRLILRKFRCDTLMDSRITGLTIVVAICMW